MMSLLQETIEDLVTIHEIQTWLVRKELPQDETFLLIRLVLFVHFFVLIDIDNKY